uniref:Uncharacterized protein n=1 Tax=Sphaerodactylus townsendi TaxID=933632 RepID=A0ACB8EWR3_9SAUR
MCGGFGAASQAGYQSCEGVARDPFLCLSPECRTLSGTLQGRLWGRQEAFSRASPGMRSGCPPLARVVSKASSPAPNHLEQPGIPFSRARWVDLLLLGSSDHGSHPCDSLAGRSERRKTSRTP